MNTQVAPAVKPKPGSREVMPKSTARVDADGARVVTRPPIRIVARLSVPRAACLRRACSARPLISPTTSTPSLDGAGDRRRRRESTSFCVSPSRRIAEDADADVADDADRLHVLPTSSCAWKSVVSRPRPLSLPAFGSRSRSAGRTPDARRLADEPDLRGEDDVLDVVGRVAGEVELAGERRRADAAVMIESRL